MNANALLFCFTVQGFATDRDSRIAVDLRDGFHTERYIFPIGYEARR